MNIEGKERRGLRAAGYAFNRIVEHVFLVQLKVRVGPIRVECGAETLQ